MLEGQLSQGLPALLGRSLADLELYQSYLSTTVFPWDLDKAVGCGGQAWALGTETQALVCRDED